jgi:hypothetical protein
MKRLKRKHGGRMTRRARCDPPWWHERLRLDRPPSSPWPSQKGRKATWLYFAESTTWSDEELALNSEPRMQLQ